METVVKSVCYVTGYTICNLYSAMLSALVVGLTWCQVFSSQSFLLDIDMKCIV